MPIKRLDKGSGITSRKIYIWERPSNWRPEFLSGADFENVVSPPLGIFEWQATIKAEAIAVLASRSLPLQIGSYDLSGTHSWTFSKINQVDALDQLISNEIDENTQRQKENGIGLNLFELCEMIYGPDSNEEFAARVVFYSETYEQSINCPDYVRPFLAFEIGRIYNSWRMKIWEADALAGRIQAERLQDSREKSACSRRSKQHEWSVKAQAAAQALWIDHPKWSVLRVAQEIRRKTIGISLPNSDRAVCNVIRSLRPNAGTD